jgi:hypothetical protein
MRSRYRVLSVFLTLSLTLVLTAGLALSSPPTSFETPVPSIGPSLKGVVQPAPGIDAAPRHMDLPQLYGAPPLGISFPGFNFLDNATQTGGYVFIPPDPIGAAGPFHVVNVGNVCIQWSPKVGAPQTTQALATFFTPTPLGTWTYDPKVIYDQYNERFVVVALERSDPTPEDSYILLAVSKTSDPNMGWWFTTIHSKVNIGGVDNWADYPGLAVGPNAVYITSNMFGFNSTGGAYAGVRLWIVDKNPFYGGGAVSWTIHDPYAGGGIATTTQPAHMFGPVPANMGTFLCSYSGLTDGTDEFVQVVQVNNPLGATSFTQSFLDVGDIENAAPALPDAPQLGSAIGIEVNDRRCLNAVWRNNELWVSATVYPAAGPDASQTTAHWWNLSATGGGAPGLNDQGDVGAEDLGTGTYTFFPSVMVDKCGNMGIGFAACNAAMYAGAYYSGRLVSDPAGTVQSTGTLAPGIDYYVRTFTSGSTGRNRWGDYSGIALDPADEETFWVYNEYADTRGTVILNEDGQWATEWGSFVMGCQPVAVAITGFQARTIDGGVELSANFTSDSDRFRVDVFRANSGAPALYKSLDYNAGEKFRFVDRYVAPGETYEYHLAVEDKDGRYLSPTSSVSIPVQEALLMQNNPNPFNPVTTIRFMLPQAQHVRLSIYDSSGKLVTQLLDEARGVGTHDVEWNGTDQLGNKVGSGVYFYRIEAGTFQQSRKMVLLK